MGEISSHNAWLLIQHANQDLKYQKKMLNLMKKESENEVAKRDIAYLTDRILIAENKPQEFGTQFFSTFDENQKIIRITLRKVRDPKNLEKRRDQMQMESFEENLDRFAKFNKIKAEEIDLNNFGKYFKK